MICRNTTIKAACLVALLATLNTYAQDNPILQGREAFSAGEYQRALDHFETAKTSGIESLTLDYNIAVSLYRLGRFDEARVAFLALATQPEWTVLITYNLGLVAEAQGNREAALAYYQQLLAQDEQERIRTLAERKVALLQPQQQAARPALAGSPEVKSWQGLLSISAGLDSNASSLADELLDNSSSAADEFVEALLYGQWYVDGQARAGTRLYALYFDRRFNEFDYLDTRLFGLGLTHERRFGAYQTEAGLRWTGTWLDSRTVANQWQAHAGISRQMQPGSFGAQYSYSRIEAGRAFPQTDGNQQRLDLSWSKRMDTLTLQARYRHERNDRADLSRNGAFASYSPVRDSLNLAVRWQVMPALTAGVAAEFIESDYAGTNRLRDTSGAIVTASRANRQQRYTLDASYRLNRNWRVRGEYQHSDVSDTFDLYTFDRNRVMATVEFEF